MFLIQQCLLNLLSKAARTNRCSDLCRPSSTAASWASNAGCIILHEGLLVAKKAVTSGRHQPPFEYWYANDEQHREQWPTATTGSQYNGSSVRPWHFYHPACVPWFCAQTIKAKQMSIRLNGGLLLLTARGVVWGPDWLACGFVAFCPGVGNISFRSSDKSPRRNNAGGQSSNLFTSKLKARPGLPFQMLARCGVRLHVQVVYFGRNIS